MELKKACIRLSEETVWTLTYKIEKDGTLTVVNFDPEDNDGHLFDAQLPKLDWLKELDGRIADRVSIDGVEYDIKNKQNVMTYRQPL